VDILHLGPVEQLGLQSASISGFHCSRRARADNGADLQSVIPTVISNKSAALAGWYVRACRGVIAAGLLTLTACEPDVPKSPTLQRIETALLARKSFTAAEAEVPDVVFYCVCGPYTHCDRESKKFANELGYELPPHKFRFFGEEQLVLFFKERDILEVEVRRFLIADDHEAFCSTDMNLTIPRSR
jgi:hypothetical protein